MTLPPLDTLAAIASAAQAEAPSPWHHKEIEDNEWRVWRGRDSVVAEAGGYPCGEPTAAHIATFSPSTCLALIERIEQLEANAKVMHEQIGLLAAEVGAFSLQQILPAVRRLRQLAAGGTVKG
jgi:hypothetical protein